MIEKARPVIRQTFCADRYERNAAGLAILCADRFSAVPAIQESGLFMVSMRSLLAYFWVDKPRVLCFILCCVIVPVLAWKYKDAFSQKVFRYIVLPSVILLVLLLNPLAAHLLVTKYETESLRFFWLVPVSVLLAIVTVRLVSALQSRKRQIMLAILVPMVMLAFSREFRSLRGTWHTRANWYKIPPVVVALDDWIMNDDGLEKTAVFPQPLDLWVRQYRPEIELPFEWKRINKESEAALQLKPIIQSTEGPVDLDEVSFWAQKGGYNYIVLCADKTCTGTLKNYQEVYRIDADPSRDTNSYEMEYILYRLAKEE